MRGTTTNPMHAKTGLETLEPRMLLCASTAITADLATALDAWWRFDEPGVFTVTDDAGSASTHDGTLNGNATVSALGPCGGAGVFAGGEMNVANHTDINLGTNAQRTLALWFNADNPNAPGRQMLYEEGGGTRGLNIYLEQGQLVVGGWNRAESGWQGTWLATDSISAGQWHHVVLTLNGDASVQPDALHAYLDGRQFGSGEGSQLWSHSGDVTIGGIGDTLFPDGGSGAAAFLGRIDDMRLYNRALAAHDVAVLSGQFNEGAAITLASTWRENLIPEREEAKPASKIDALQRAVDAEQPDDTRQDTDAGDVKTDLNVFAAPGVDETPTPADPAPADPAPPAEPTPTPHAPNAATNETDTDTDAGSTHVAGEDDAAPDDEPQVAEVPTDGKGQRESHDRKHTRPAMHTRVFQETRHARND